jgi:hypothetical protein
LSKSLLSIWKKGHRRHPLLHVDFSGRATLQERRQSRCYSPNLGLLSRTICSWRSRLVDLVGGGPMSRPRHDCNGLPLKRRAQARTIQLGRMAPLHPFPERIIERHTIVVGNDVDAQSANWALNVSRRPGIIWHGSLPQSAALARAAAPQRSACRLFWYGGVSIRMLVRT